MNQILFKFKLYFPLSTLTLTKDCLLDANGGHPCLKLNPGDEVLWSAHKMDGVATVGDGRIYHENNPDHLHFGVQIQEMNLTVKGDVNFDVEADVHVDDLSFGL